MSVLFGIFEKDLYRNELDGKALFSVRVSENIKERNRFGFITVSATIPPYRKGTPLYLEGEWKEGPKGKRLAAKIVREEAWNIASAAEFLGSGLCKGIGYAKARAIVSRLGAFNIFESMYESGAEKQVAKTLNVSMEQAQTLCAAVRQTVIQRKLFSYVVRYGGFWSAVSKLYDAYGANALAMLKQNPYTVGMKAGMTFEQCDRIARDEGITAVSVTRLRAVATQAAKMSSMSGDVFIPIAELYKRMRSIMENDAYGEGELPASLLVTGVTDNRELTIEQDLYENVYLARLYHAERNAAAQIVRLQQASTPQQYDETIPEQIEAECGIRYAEQQKEAFRLLKRSGISILTGGPGTGKTTVINGLIAAYQKLHPNARVKLCAPTGRAAQRMTESTGLEAVTVHRLLDFRPYGQGDVMYKNADNPINAGLIIMDEVSMLDTELLSIFLSAVKSDTSVLFVGDENQLPSVGPGNVLHDMISAGIPTVRLSAVYRQSSQSPIIQNAQRINDGNSDLIECSEFGLWFTDNPKNIAHKILSRVCTLYDPQHPFDVQVLTPVRGGDAGVIGLNNMLQQMLNPRREGEPELAFGWARYRLRDKIIMLSNNYEKGYYNGDLGVVTDIADGCLTVDIMGKRIDIEREIMKDVSLSYAMTVHKAQGSEYKHVIIALPYKPANMLQRNLLFTAVTRAKTSVMIISENGALQKAVKTCNARQRNTRLQYLLEKSLKQ